MLLAPDSIVEPQTDQILAAMAGQMRKDPEFAEMEAEFPGLIDAAIIRVRPIMIRAAYKGMPAYRADLSKLYQDNLTEAELREAVVFFRSPEMQAFIASAQRNMKFENSARSMVAEADPSSADLRKDITSAATQTARELPPEKLRKVEAFMESPLGRKLASLNPQRQAVNLRHFNRSDPAMEKEIEIATIEAMIDHVARTDPKLARDMRKALEDEGALPRKDR